MKKILIILGILLVSLPVYSEYSNIKQRTEYNCGPVSSANCIINLFDKQFPNMVQDLTKIEKTKTSGTTVTNLCRGLNKYLNQNNLKANISYYGIINADKKYQKLHDISLEKLQGQGIVNFGIYKRYNDTYIRQEGHYVTITGIGDNTIYVLDPYSKHQDVENWTFEKQKLNLINKDKYETFSQADEYYVITSPVDYLEEGEFAILNGVIIINPA